jgi:hypothetical protein
VAPPLHPPAAVCVGGGGRARMDVPPPSAHRPADRQLRCIVADGVRAGVDDGPRKTWEGRGISGRQPHPLAFPRARLIVGAGSLQVHVLRLRRHARAPQPDPGDTAHDGPAAADGGGGLYPRGVLLPVLRGGQRLQGCAGPSAASAASHAPSHERADRTVCLPPGARTHCRGVDVSVESRSKIRGRAR